MAVASPVAFVALATPIGLIFGGCCSNVYALEAIIQSEPDCGTLITFAQFLFVASTSYVAQFNRAHPPFFLTPTHVPLRRWFINILLFFSVNILNNYAFSFNISVPMHIILRSGGSVTTMLAGVVYGKRYTHLQFLAVFFLTSGICLAAWSDANSKATVSTPGNINHTSSTFGGGVMILLTAQILSAVMGLHTESIYQKYGPQWRENLFITHALALPLFIPILSPLIQQARRVMSSPPILTRIVPGQSSDMWGIGMANIPSQVVFLAVNVLTQSICIRGVNLLAAVSSALTVTIMLNVRKLFSLLLSVWLFDNSLTSGTLVGALIVFASGALYTLDSKQAAPTNKETR